MRVMADAVMDVNIRPPFGKTHNLDTALVGAVKRACQGNNFDPGRPEVEIVRVLVDIGADVNTMSMSTEREYTGTGKGLFSGRSRLVEVLESETILSIVETSRPPCPQVVSILKKAGACRDLEGRRLRWEAATPTSTPTP